VKLKVAGFALAALALGGCVNLSNLQFRGDHRLHFVAPRADSLVRLPLTLRWTMSDFDVVPPNAQPPSAHAGYFAIFIDRYPVRPGQSLTSVAANDPICAHHPGCPDAAYLAQYQIYTTTTTSLRLDAVQPLAGNNDRRQTHRAIVILLDTSGRRIGEVFWSISFDLNRPTI